MRLLELAFGIALTLFIGAELIAPIAESMANASAALASVRP